jgi:hypothetical protein
MAPATTDYAETCTVDRPTSRRFYVHAGSLGFLVTAQPTFYGEVAHSLALSGASRALDQAVQDWEFFSSDGADPELAEAARIVHEEAAEALQNAFQCIVQLVPPRFGATELLLGGHEKINAWCYEDGYLTYATDETAAAIMYAETGSLRKLRSEIRRSPGFDPALEMISGQRLFLYDQRFSTGPGTARLYKQHASRLLRDFRRTSVPTVLDDKELRRILEECLRESAETFDGHPVLDYCVHRAGLMVTTLLHSLPTGD